MIGRIIEIFTDPEVVPRLRAFIMMLIVFKVLTVAMLRSQGTAFARGLDVVGSVGFVMAIVFLATLMVCKRLR